MFFQVLFLQKYIQYIWTKPESNIGGWSKNLILANINKLIIIFYGIAHSQ